MKFLEYITERSRIGEKIQVKTKKDRTGHIHNAYVDAEGNGNTYGHYDHDHTIFEHNVQPSKGHIHELDMKKRR